MLCLHSKKWNTTIRVFFFPGKPEVNSWTPVNSDWIGHMPRCLQVSQHTAHTACAVSALPRSRCPPPRRLLLSRTCGDGQILSYKSSETEAKILLNQFVRPCALTQSILVETSSLLLGCFQNQSSSASLMPLTLMP